jgi:hypothetical protein
MNSLRQTRLHPLRSLLPVALMIMPLLMAGLSVDAEAVQRSVLRSHNSGTFTSTSTRTGANGAVTTRSSTSVLDKSAGTWTRSAPSTGPNGKTSTMNATVVKTDNGYVRDASRTGPNGNTVSTNTVGSYDKDNHTATRTTTVTGPNGQSSTHVTTKRFTPAQ